MTATQQTRVNPYAIKSLSGGRVGGYLVVWGSPEQRDLQGEYFTRNTDLGLDWFKSRPVLYHHGLDSQLQATVIGVIDTLKTDEVGLWAEAQLDMRHRYVQAVQGLVDQGVLGWSSGSIPHLVVVDNDGYIRRWPIVEGSLTPSPAEPRGTGVGSLKHAHALPTGRHLTTVEAIKSVKGIARFIDLKALAAAKAGETSQLQPLEAGTSSQSSKAGGKIMPDTVVDEVEEVLNNVEETLDDLEETLDDVAEVVAEVADTLPPADTKRKSSKNGAKGGASGNKRTPRKMDEEDDLKMDGEADLVEEQIEMIVEATADELGVQLTTDDVETVVEQVEAAIEDRTGESVIKTQHVRAAFKDGVFRRRVINTIRAKAEARRPSGVIAAMRNDAQALRGSGGASQVPAHTGKGAPTQRVAGGAQRRVPDISVGTKFSDLSAEDMAYYFDVRSKWHRANGLAPYKPGQAFWRELAEKASKGDKLEAMKAYLPPESDENRHSYKALKAIQGIKSDELNYTSQADYGQDWVPDLWSSQLWENVRRDNKVLSAFMTVDMPSNPFELPLEGADPVLYRVGETTDDSQMGTNGGTAPSSKVGTVNNTITAYKGGIRVPFSAEMEEDSIIQFIPQARKQMMFAMANGLDHAILQADPTLGATNINDYGGTVLATDPDFWLLGWPGILQPVLSDANAKVDMGNAAPTLQQLRQTRRLLDEKFIDKTNDLVWFVDSLTHHALLDVKEFLTVDKYGPQATVLTGEIGKIDGTPVVVTDQLGRGAADGRVSTTSADNVRGRAALVYVPWYKVGYRRDVATWFKYYEERDAYQLGAWVRIGFIRRNAQRSAVLLYNIAV